MRFSRFLIPSTFICLFFVFTSSSLAFQDKNPLLDLVPEKTVAYCQWDSTFSNTKPELAAEKWLSQKAAIEYFKATAKAQEKLVNVFFDSKPNESGLLKEAALLIHIGTRNSLQHPGQFVSCITGTLKEKVHRRGISLEQFEDEEFRVHLDEEDIVEVEKSLFGFAFCQKITGDKKQILGLIEQIRKKNQTKKVKTSEHFGITFHRIPRVTELKTGKKKNFILAGFKDDYLFIADTAGLKALEASKGKPKPDWFKKFQEKKPEKRQVFRGYLNFESLFKLQEMPPYARSEVAYYGLNNLKDGFLWVGLNQKDTVTRAEVTHKKKPTGLVAILKKQKGIAAKQLDQVDGSLPLNVHAKLDWSKLPLAVFQSKRERLRGEDTPTLEDFFEETENETGVHLGTFSSSFGSDFQLKGKLGFPNPFISWTFKNSLKNQEKYEEQFSQFLDNGGDGFLRIQEDSIKDTTVHTIRTHFYPDLSIANDEKSVVAGFSKRRTVKLLGLQKKPEKSGAKALPFTAQLFDKKFHQSKGELIAFARFDFADFANRGLAALKMITRMSRHNKVNSETLKNLPDLKDVLKNTHPMVVGLYRSDDRIELVCKQNVPQILPTALSHHAILHFTYYELRYSRSEEDDIAGSTKNRSTNHFNYQGWEIGSGIRSFRNSNGAYPAAYTVDKDNKKLLSWRVHILPHIGESELYDQFNLDEPWDSPNNIKLLKKMPKIYAVDRSHQKEGKTSVKAIVGKDTLFGLPAERYFDCPEGIDAADVPEEHKPIAIVVITKKDFAVPWTSPQDFHCDEEKAEEQIVNKEDTQIAYLLHNGQTKEHKQKHFWRFFKKRLRVKKPDPKDSAKKD